MKNIKYYLFGTLLTLCAVSCSDDLLVPTLDGKLSYETSINTLEDLKAVSNGMYIRMRGTAYYGRDIIIFDEVRSDNTYSNGNSGRFVNAGKMDILSSDAYPTDTFASIYQTIASANVVANATITGDQVPVNHYKGQALAVRALSYFNLVKLYGQQNVTGAGDQAALAVPYITKYKDLADGTPKRNTVAEVKTKIYADLDQALTLMTTSLNNADRINITTFAVNAIKSRVAIYFKDWALAKTSCEAVMAGGFSIVPAASFAGSFTPTVSATNRIFELKATTVDNNGINGLANIYRGASYADVVPLQDLVNTFSATDVRGTVGGTAAMIQTVSGVLRNMGKYPTMATFHDNIKVCRYEEVVLNYAEALFRINAADPNALTQLNSIPNARNAGAVYTSVTEDNILLERRKELCFEGFRFSDLARTGRNIPLVDALKQSHAGPIYGSIKYAFPIPISELNANPSMVQNKGY